MTFNGTPQTVNPAAWIAVNCGHEIQINDSPEAPGNDPRKTGSIYGFADLNSAQSRPTPLGVWNDLAGVPPFHDQQVLKVGLGWTSIPRSCIT